MSNSLRFVFAVRVSILAISSLAVGTVLRGQSEDGGQTHEQHQAVLQSIEVPHVPNQPFSLTLLTEWDRTLRDGRVLSLVNARPIARDRQGRVYQERWLLAPKNSRLPLRMSWIQIADPIAHTLLECNARTLVCDLENFHPEWVAFEPNLLPSGPEPGGKTVREHQDLGTSKWLGVDVHHYRDTVRPVTGSADANSVIRDFSYAPSLSLNLLSTVESTTLGKQSFTVSKLTAGDPDPALFQAPGGYTVRDVRNAPARQDLPTTY